MRDLFKQDDPGEDDQGICGPGSSIKLLALHSVASSFSPLETDEMRSIVLPKGRRFHIRELQIPGFAGDGKGKLAST